MTPKLLGNLEVESYVKHLIHHMSESGIDNIIYTPYHRGYIHSADEMKKNIQGRLDKDLSDLKWGRAFVICDGEKIVGHLDLQGAHMESSMHRCRMGMGLDKEYRGKGLGLQLLNFVILWLRQETKLEWLDLYTFSHNLPAIALYKKVGFKEVGTVEDLFRVDGEKISDIQMVLKL